MPELLFKNRRTKLPLPLDEYGTPFVTQYQEWSVEVVDPAIEHIYLSFSEQMIALDREDSGAFRLPSKGANGYKGSDAGGSAGYLQLYALMDNTPRELSPGLHVSPASINQDEFNLILERLSRLSESPRGVFWASMKNRRYYFAAKEEALCHKADRLLKLSKACMDAWQWIQRSPAMDLSLIEQTIKRRSNPRAFGPRSYRLRLQRPHSEADTLSTLGESKDVLENQFVCGVFSLILTVGGALESQISRELARGSVSRSVNDIYAKVLSLEEIVRIEESQTSIHNKGDKVRQRLSGALAGIQETTKAIAIVLKRSFLAGTTQSLIDVGRPPRRLTHSKEYGPLYAVFRAYQDARRNEEGMISDSVLKAIEQRGIYPVQKLYELWTLLELYDALVVRFGFRCASGSVSPLEMATMDDRQISIPSGAKFKLEFSLADQPNRVLYRIELQYDVTVTRLNGQICQPDINMQVRDEMGSVTQFILDAKYRRYASHKLARKYAKEMLKENVKTVYELDLLATAKTKYLDELGSKAAFILHSDSAEYDFWGGNIEPPERFTSAFPRLTDYPNHSYGAVSCKPGAPDTIPKLLSCFFMFHLRQTDICWQCRLKVPAVDNVKAVGVHHLCPSCGRFWVISHCKANRHKPLVKLGSKSFHDVKKTDEWNCTCPTCGDKFMTSRAPSSEFVF